MAAPGSNSFWSRKAKHAFTYARDEGLGEKGHAFLPLINRPLHFTTIRANPFSARIHAPLNYRHTLVRFQNDRELFRFSKINKILCFTGQGSFGNLESGFA